MEERTWFVDLTLNKTFTVCATSAEEAKRLAIEQARNALHYDSLYINKVEPWEED